jgi:threonyl-tRNA synthetase
MKIIYDGKELNVKDNIPGSELADDLKVDAIAIKINGSLYDLNTKISENSNVEFVTLKDKEGIEILRHSHAHQLAQAVQELYPDAKLTIGPVVENGFYYDIDFNGKTISPDDLKVIEKRMYEIAKRKLPIVREEISKEDALELFKDNKYKIELINEYGDGQLTIYRQGDFFDLCRGPHVPNTKILKNFKLTKVSGSYWRADSSREQLQRIYGIAFPTKEELKEFLGLQEEAKKRDHRKLGKELDLFSFHEEAPGMPFFHNKGTFIWNKLVSFMTELLEERNYELVKTPIVLNTSLWKQSGHWDHYKENIYFTKIDEVDYGLKPMNCPGHILIYKNKRYSYRELPLKMAEFGLVHRHELSGVLSGLFRVRAFTQDDAHVFCTREQIEQEVNNLLELIDVVYSTFGFEYEIELSTKPDKAMGDPKLWEEAESTLKKSLEKLGKGFKINEGDGAFYGPKIDFHLKDAIGRTWQCGTIQLDFQMPEKFDLTYESKNNTRERVVMLHRAILGSVERFLGILVEHYAGKFPLWIAPEQIRIMTISDEFLDYANELKSMFEKHEFRVTIDKRSESISKKVRDAQLQKIPIMLTIGEKEMKDKKVSLRTLDNKVAFGVDVNELISKIKSNIDNKEQRFVW